MKATWNWSRELEANRLINTCYFIANGFYALNKFTVAPTTMAYYNHCVYLPELPYDSTPHFWELVKDSNINTIPVNDPHDLAKQLLPYLKDLAQPNYAAMQNNWTTHQTTIFKKVEGELGISLTNYVLTIYPTYFGTSGSFNHSQEQQISVWLRIDSDLTHLVEIIVSALLRPLHNAQGLSWGESEAVIDHLVTSSPIGQILKRIDPTQYVGTLQPLRAAKSAELEKISQEFLHSIGAPINAPQFSVQDNRPYVNNQPLHHLTTRESIILTKLIELQGKTLSLDDLASVIFQSDEEYSLAVLTKVIERLRDKLERNGISKSYLQSERKSGYFLRYI